MKNLYLLIAIIFLAFAPSAYAQEEITALEEVVIKHLNFQEIKVELQSSINPNCFSAEEFDKASNNIAGQAFGYIKEEFFKKLFTSKNEPFDYDAYVRELIVLTQNELRQIPCKELAEMASDKGSSKPHTHGGTPKAAGEPCTNPGFELCNFTSWILQKATVTGAGPYAISAPVASPGFTTVSASATTLPGTNQHAIVNGGTDAIGGFPMVCPTGGSCSALIGDFQEAGYNASVLTQTFLVSPTDAVLVLNYAAVLQDPGHSFNDQPFFRVRVFDQLGNALACGSYEATAGDGQAGWMNAGSYRYLPWTTVMIPLTGYIGTNVTVQFVVGDCNLGGHAGYAYVDAQCQAFELTITGSDDCAFPITLTAPAGAASYVWDSGQTSQSITVNAAGTYGVNIIPLQGLACGNYVDTVVFAFVTPTANAGPDFSICQGNSVQLQGSGVGNAASTLSWNNAGSLSNPNIYTPNATPAVTTTYTLTVNNNDGCLATDNVTVTVTPYADATINPQGNVCNTAPAFNLTSVQPGGTWSGTGITNAATGTFNPGIAGPGTHTITYTIAGLCPDTRTTNITVIQYLSPTITPAGPFCNDDAAVNLTAANPGGTWSGTGITNAANGTFNPAIAGAGTHTITYTIAGLCGDFDTENIVVNQRADATINPQGNVCNVDPAFNMTSLQPGGTWSGTGITNAATGTFNPATAGAGTHIITYTIGGPCPDTKTTNVTVEQYLAPTITPAGPFCDDAAAVNLTAANPGGTWSGTGITNAATGTFNPAIAGAGTHTITYTIAGLCGDFDTENILVNPRADATINPQASLCDNSASVTLTGVQAGGTWSGTGITNAANGTFDPTVSGAGNFTITYSIAGPCPDSKTINIFVEPFADPTITPAGPFCESVNSVTLTAASNTGIWSGTGITNANTGAFSPAIAGPGSHIITYTTPGGCGSVDTETIIVGATVDASITPVPNQCSNGAPIQLTAADPNGVWSGAGITNSATGMFDPTITGPGTHTITYTITDICSDQQTTNILVYQPMQAFITPDTLICVYGTATVNSGASLGSGAYNYSWVNGMGNSPGFNNNPGGPVTYTVDITDGCTIIQLSMDVTIEVIPNIDFVADTLIGCPDLTVNFTNLSGAGSANCIWDFGNGDVQDNCVGATTVYTAPGCYDVNLQVVTPIGCTDNYSKLSYICLGPNPIAKFITNKTEMLTTNTKVEFTNQSQNADSYQWNFGDGASSVVVHPIHTYPEESGVYTIRLVASNNFGCRDTAYQNIKITEDLLFFVPNAFTPDNDEFNQTWRPIMYSGLDPLSYHVEIYNRWGEMIWESFDQEVGWDGTYTGVIVKEGVYTWKLTFRDKDTDKRREYTGHLNLLR